MDDPWYELGCDPFNPDHRFSSFYNHPVWLLNGLFVDQDKESIEHRQRFSDWAVTHEPIRVADYGGGFGTLARILGSALPSAQIEVVEPHPHPGAIALASQTPNVVLSPS